MSCCINVRPARLAFPEPTDVFYITITKSFVPMKNTWNTLNTPQQQSVLTTPIVHAPRIVLTIFLSFLFGFLGAFVAMRYIPQSPSDMIRDHYDSEMNVMISPSTLRKRMDAKDTSYILVDLRSKAEYDKEHIITAINIPAVSMSKEQIIEAFKKLPNNKEIIVHCYSMVCMLGRQTGQVLAAHNIFVKELGIGWSEWKYYWGLWNPGENPEKGKEYITTSSDAEKSIPAPLMAPCTAGEFGC